MEIGRNDACPCGSGKKYKKCCGSNLHPAGYTEEENSILRLNKWLAYRGKVGREREAFCRAYIENKKNVIQAIQDRQVTESKGRGEAVSCRQGCVYCCYHYVTSTLDEIEAIVYYLYQNEDSLNYFLTTYRNWKVKIEEYKSLMTDISQAYNTQVRDNESSEKQTKFHLLANRYLDLDLPCPFLKEKTCIIYPVRPWVCASFFAVSPPDWCGPKSENKPRTMSVPHCKEMNQISHYRKYKGFWTTTPKAVYSVLQSGIYALTKIPGLETLEKETLEDPEVRELISKIR
jgi:Fe-S-cluster containining protein